MGERGPRGHGHHLRPQLSRRARSFARLPQPAPGTRDHGRHPRRPGLDATSPPTKASCAARSTMLASWSLRLQRACSFAGPMSSSPPRRNSSPPAPAGSSAVAPCAIRLRVARPVARIDSCRRRDAAVRVLDWLEQLELFLYRRAAAIVSVTNAFRRESRRRAASTRAKIHVVTNGVGPDAVRTATARTGAGGAARARGQVRRRLYRHARHGAWAGQGARGGRTLRDRMTSLSSSPARAAERGWSSRSSPSAGWTNVRLFPRQPKERMPALWSVCDAALVRCATRRCSRR